MAKRKWNVMPFPNLDGRPLKFPSPEGLQSIVNEYFAYCDSLNPVNNEGRVTINKPYTVTGLCDYIGLHKDNWLEYEKRDGYTYIVKNAKQKVETFTVEMASINKTNPIMAIFNLKNNFGYSDKIDVTTNNQPEQLNPTDIKKMLNDKGRERILELNGS